MTENSYKPFLNYGTILKKTFVQLLKMVQCTNTVILYIIDII